MDLTDRQRRLAFAGLVVVLAAVGVYLTVAGGGAAGDESAGATAAASPTTSGTASPPAGSASPSSGAATPSPEESAFDIYPLLPFGEKDFAAAADVAKRFTSAYGTYRYDEGPQAYLSRLDPLMTGDLRTEIARGVGAPGLVQQRQQEQYVSTGDATVEAIRDIEQSSIIFVVAGRQQVTKSGTTSENSARYSVTVSKDGGSWKVYAFQPADVGQAGDTG